MTKNNQSSLTLNLSTHPYILQLIIQDWLSLHDATKLISVSVPNTPRYANFFSKSHEINRHFLKNADISELKLLLRKGLQSESFLAHIDKKDLREPCLKGLTHPDADLEYRLLALNFLSEPLFVLQLPPDLHNKPFDPFIFLLYSTTFSAIDSQVITEYFQQWLDDIEKDPSVQKKGLESAVLMLGLIGHKLAKETTQSFVLRLFNCVANLHDPRNVKHRNAPRLGLLSVPAIEDQVKELSVLAIEYQVKDMSEMIKWLIVVYGNYVNFSDVLKRIFSKFPSTFESIELQTLLDDMKGGRARAQTVKAAASLWHALTFSGREKLLETLLVRLQNDVSKGVRLEALKAVISLWFALKDSQREEVKIIALTMLAMVGNINSGATGDILFTALEAVLSLWQTFEDSQREQLKVIALETLNKISTEEMHKYLWSALDKPERATVTNGIRVMDAVILCWSDLNEIQQKNEMAKVLSYDGLSLSSWNVVEIAFLRWLALDEVQREQVRRKILTILNDNEKHHNEILNILIKGLPLHFVFEYAQHNEIKEMILAFLRRCPGIESEHHLFYPFAIINIIKTAISLSHDLEPAQYETIMKSSFRLFKSENTEAREAGRQFIISCIPLLSAEQLAQTVEKLTVCLNSDHLDHRMRALDILMEVICHYPNHEYSLNALQDSPLKDYLSHAIDTIQTAQASHPQLRI